MSEIPGTLRRGLLIPAIAAPMFLVSGPDLVVETCRAGLIGTFPSLNQRTSQGFADWCDEIAHRLDGGGAPWGVNLIVHKSNPRVRADLEICVSKRVPLIITSLGAVPDVVNAVHSYGGLVFHDVVNGRHAEKAAAAGVDGIIAVAAGAGGHSGTLSPFALIAEIRSVFTGLVILSGAVSTGRDIAAARAMGADLAYLGSRFIATRESLASEAQKQMMLGARAADIVHTASITGIAANFMRESLTAAGLDPDHLPSQGKLGLDSEARAWKTIWSAGHGVGNIRDVPATAALCHQLIVDYHQALKALAIDPFVV